jgi:hypothetical protein
MIIFNNDCEWGWEDWVESYLYAVLEHASITAEEICAEDMDEDNIYIYVKEWDPVTNVSIENEYCIHYVDDAESMIGLTFFYTLFRREDDGYLYLQDYGAYRIERANGVCQCTSLANLL